MAQQEMVGLSGVDNDVLVGHPGRKPFSNGRWRQKDRDAR
jgi:hypothetical protein